MTLLINCCVAYSLFLKVILNGGHCVWSSLYKEKNNNTIKQEVDSDDESRFNSEEYHKKQHDF